MRASRLLSILILLQLRGRLTAQSLAAEFEVSARTIYRDVDELSASGVPVISDRGPGGGFLLQDGYRTQLTGLSADEAEAMLMIGLPGPAAALGLGPAVTTASRKLLAALPRSGRDEATRISERFHLDPVDWYRATEPVPHLPAIARAVLDQRCIAMKYESWRSTRRWRIEPLGVVLKAGSWYVVARVSGKSGVDSFRNFKIANVIEFAVDEASFERPADFDLAGHWAQSLARFEAGLRPTKATLRASELGLFRLSELGRYAADAVREADPSDADGWARVRLPIETIERAALSLLSIGAEVEVLEPALLRDQVRTVAAQITHRADKRSFEQANGVHKKEKLDG